jgi:hypothetical protein
VTDIFHIESFNPDLYFHPEAPLKYAVYKDVVQKDGKTLIEHCGFIFENYLDAEAFVQGQPPRHCVKINWDLFPAESCYGAIP